MRPAAPNAALRPDQKRSRCSSLFDTSTRVAPLVAIRSRTTSTSAATSAGTPSDSQSRIASASPG